MVQRCQIAAQRWLKDISSAADNAIFKTMAQNIECSFGCVAHGAFLLKPNVANIFLFNFCEQKFAQDGSIMIAIDYKGLCLFFFEEIWPNYTYGLKSAANCDLSWVRRLFNVCVRVFLFTYPPRSKWASSEKMIFLPKSASSVSRSQRMHNYIRSAVG